LLFAAAQALLAREQPAAHASAQVRDLLPQATATPTLAQTDLPSEEQINPVLAVLRQESSTVAFGLAIANDTPEYAPEYIGDALSCSSCHIDAGRRGNAWPWLGIASSYPRYDPRSGQTITLAERIQQCFLRSMNGTAPVADDRVILSLIDYINTLDDVKTNYPPGPEYEAVIPAPQRIPMAQLSVDEGGRLYGTECVSCHGANGEGLGDAPPLWGLRSYNQGAGAGRVWSLAGFIRQNMPASAPGTLSYEEAQQIAFYVDSQPRPPYAGMADDYPGGTIPPDGLYYLARLTPTPTPR
jgi:thiosulfate dehydrogenase